MKKYFFILAAALATLCLAFSSCKKDTEPGDGPSNPGGGTPTSNIIATTFDTPLEIYRKGNIDIAGNQLWFAMESEGRSFHTPYSGVSVLATPKPDNSPYTYDEDVILNEGDEIGPGGYFSQSDTCDFMDWYWQGDEGAYCGISFQKEGKTHYGWVKFKFITTSCRAFICGYAYENVPNKSIKAGAIQ